MSLGSILGIASSGLASVNQQLAVVSQNVANAGTPGYARETAADTDLTAGGQGFGVVTGPATVAVDTALQSALAGVNASQTRADQLSEAYDKGQTTDVAKVMLARQEAGVGFEATCWSWTWHP